MELCIKKMMKKRLFSILVALVVFISFNPIIAKAYDEHSITPYFNNIGVVALSLWFDDNDVAYCGITLTPYSHCTGMDGMLRLFDPNGVQLKSWAVSDYTEPYMIEKTWQCSQKGDYTLTFQGYAYGENTMYDDLVLSITTEND